MKKQKIVYLYDYRKEANPPSNLIEYINWLSSILASVPEEFKNTVSTNIDGITNGDYGVLEYTISYSRPETDKEEKERGESESKEEKLRKDRELKEFKRLKKKYNL